MQVTIQSDRRTRSRAMQNRAETTSRRRYAIAAPRLDRQGQITAFSQPTVTVTIQTTYGPGVSGEAVSGYGRGTTATDVSAGQTTLRFHEGSHGQDYLDYLSTNPPPTLQATVGMTIAEFRQAQQEYQQAFEAYFQAMDQASLHQTDCVGTTIDQATGSQVCPTP
ncbi:MAG: hypothetical protein HC769_30965 [Cyanobacteria bacterium CRU_2_1]|nr:hypothetical protein [Cyanobacteria bacterium CRU_2_1]